MQTSSPPKLLIWVLWGGVALVAADMAALAAAYIAYPGYLDHGEPAVAAMAWHVLDGHQAYPRFDAPGRITNIYGPLAYAVHIPFLLLFGAGAGAEKMATPFLALLLPVVLFMSQRRRGTAVALTAALMGAGYVLNALPAGLWNRPDVAMAILAALGLLAMNESRPGQPEWDKSALIAVIGGLAVGMKIHGGLYLLPIALHQCCGRGFKTFGLMVLVGGATALAPFALPVHSLAGLASWFGPVAGKANPAGFVQAVLEKAVFYAFPLAFPAFAGALRRIRSLSPDAVFAGAFAAALVIALFGASKPGAGSYYYLPFAATAIEAGFRFAPKEGSGRRLAMLAIGLVAAASLTLSIPKQKRTWRAFHWEETRAVAAEIEAIMTRHPHRRLQMGIGENPLNYWRTWFRVPLIQAGNPYTLDGAIITETSALGIRLAAGTLDLIRSCDTEFWLIPAGERPFAMKGYYGNPMFDDAFRQAFQDHHARAASGKFFDLWECRAADPLGAPGPQ